MVEMIGVLAIMGVLTVAGIAGFRVAMNKHYCNQTINRLMMRAVIIATERQMGQEAVSLSFDPNDGKYPISNTVDFLDEDTFRLSISNVPKEICNQLVTMDWNTAKVIPQDCSDTTLQLIFLNDLSDCTNCPTGGFDCTPYSNIECGKCTETKGFIPNDDDCENSENGEYCKKGHCSFCTHDSFWSSKTAECIECNESTYSSDTYWSTTQEHIHDCLGKMFMRNYGGDLRLYSCNIQREMNLAEEESCKACAKRCWNGNGSCPPAGDNQTYARAADGTCICKHCQSCPSDKFWSNSALKCIECNESTYSSDTYWSTTQEHIHDCLGKMFMRNYGGDLRLYSCNIQREMNLTEEESCKACAKRCWNGNGACPPAGDNQTYARAADGTCICKHCQSCPSDKFWSNSALKCIECNESTYSSDTYWSTTQEHIHDCLGKMFMRNYGGNLRLYSCNIQREMNLAEEESCKACPNRCYLNGTCYLAGPDKTYRRVSETDGTCVTN